ncbi:hypothetical protein AO498_15320 [Algoriphagus sanaruensis]|uniref:Uncharacterized protein n=1 Tax=Algoriphagus sanaruensis TaxID=1727163 RepID=A0A142ERR8_9BACT|nr:hypothetical protein AO498_15320 [Algoriphagus sanaruensis]
MVWTPKTPRSPERTAKVLIFFYFGTLILKIATKKVLLIFMLGFLKKTIADEFLILLGIKVSEEIFSSMSQKSIQILSRGGIKKVPQPRDLQAKS